MTENKNKSGVYRVINIKTSKTYIGSSVNLGRRFTSYFSFKYIDAQKTSLMCKALLKYGYSSFQLEILEYCEPSVLLAREQYFLDLLCPEYNIKKKAGSILGYKHTKETILKLKARKHTEEAKNKIKKTLMDNHYKANRLEILDTKTNSTISYNSVRQAAEALQVSKTSLFYHINNKKFDDKLYRNRYIVNIKRSYHS